MYINPDDAVFQLGRYLYETQVLLAELEKGDEINREHVKDVCLRYCELISAVGMLRSTCNQLVRDIKKIREMESSHFRDVISLITESLGG